MLKIGLTGGIGSGKTTVAKIFMELGVPVYFADDQARILQNKEPLKSQIKAAFGDDLYESGLLNRAKLASIVFADSEQLNVLNAIVHPAVARDFDDWLASQTAPYIIKEAAIIFEIGSQSQFDKIILVTAPREERLARVIARDHTTAQHVEERMDQQWNDERKSALADFVVNNTDLNSTKKSILAIHNQLLELQK